MPISANKVVQTGANNHAGGLRAGLGSVAYHVGMDWAVKIEPIIPAASDIPMAIISLEKLLIFIFVSDDLFSP